MSNPKDPKVRPDGYIELNKTGRGLKPNSPDLQQGVEYMYVLWYRQNQSASSQIYGKNRSPQPSQQTVTDIHAHLKLLETQGWYERASTRDGEGFEVFLERQHIRTINPAWKPPLPEGVIPLNERHNADSNKLYCILSIDRDTQPYEWMIHTYGRDVAVETVKGDMADAQKINREQGPALIARLESEGWQRVHTELVRGGSIHETVYFVRPIDYVPSPSVAPSPAPTSQTSAPTPVYLPRPQRKMGIKKYDAKHFEEGVEYLYIEYYRSTGRATLEFYGKHMPLHTEEITVSDLHVLRKLYTERGWSEVFSVGSGEGVMVYLERQFAPEGYVADAPAPEPEQPKPTYLPRPKRSFGVDQYGTLEAGVEYFRILWYRDDNSATLEFYGKDIPLRSQRQTIEDLFDYRKQIQAEGWTEVFSTGDAEGILVYMERGIDPNSPVPSVPPIPDGTIHKAPTPKASASPTTPPSIPSPAQNQTQAAMIGGERCSIVHPKGTMYVDVVEGEQSQRHLSTMPHAMIARLNTDGWAHIATMPSDKQTVYIMGRGGVLLMEAYLDPANHANLPDNVRLLRVVEYNGQVTVTTYDKQSADTNPNTSTSAQEFAQKLLGMGKWSLVREDRADGYIVIYLGMQI